MSGTNTVLFILAIVVGFCIIFPIFWCFVVWIISRFGWASLAERYATELPPYGDTYAMQTMRIGLSRYSGTINITANETGIFAEPMWVFRFGHKRLFIPWSEMHDPQPTMVRWFNQVSFRVGYPEIAKITLHNDLIASAARHLAIS